MQRKEPSCDTVSTSPNPDSTDIIIRGIFHSHADVVRNVVASKVPAIRSLCEQAVKIMKAGGKILLMGNGGSAADCQHIAAEFIGRFRTKRQALPAIALTTDTSTITALANDFGYESVFERQIAALCQGNDLVIGISTSGRSANILRGIAEARRRNATTSALLGRDGGPLEDIVDIPVTVDSMDTARIQEIHILIGHIVCEYCDECFQ